MDNELVLLQMRKIGYDNAKGVGIAQADLHYQLLEWLQDAYNHDGLTGKFYSDNIIREVWNRFSKQPNPLQEMSDYSAIYDSFEMVFSGSWWLACASASPWDEGRNVL